MRLNVVATDIRSKTERSFVESEGWMSRGLKAVWRTDRLFVSGSVAEVSTS